MNVPIGNPNPYDLRFLGYYLFGIGIVGLGVEHFIFGDFIMGRAPSWPSNWSGKMVWAYCSGVLFILAGIETLFKKRIPFLHLLSAFVVFCWALIRHIPLVLSDSPLGGNWTSAGKAPVFIGGFLAISSLSRTSKFHKNDTPLPPMGSKRTFHLIARVCLGLFLVLTGIQHILYMEFVASLIPKWFPGNPVFWTYFSGMALLIGGIGLVLPKVYGLAAICVGTMIFSWVWVVHLPRIHLGMSDQIAVFEALCFSGIALMLTKPSLAKP